MPKSNTASTAVGPKRAGVIRLGIAAVKPGNVAEHMNAQTLATAVQNTYQEQLKSANVEAVLLDATGGAAIQAEAQQKECDYVVYTIVSHKKGGGGFGSMIGSAASVAGSTIGYGNTAAAVSANVATATVAQTVKAKDEVTLNVRLERPGSTTPKFAQDFKGKAKSGGEDIITPLVQQASQGIMTALQ